MRIRRMLAAIFREMEKLAAIATSAEFDGQPELTVQGRVIAKRRFERWAMLTTSDPALTPSAPDIMTLPPFSLLVEIPERGATLIAVPERIFREAVEGEKVVVSYRVGRYSGEVSARLE